MKLVKVCIVLSASALIVVSVWLIGLRPIRAESSVAEPRLAAATQFPFGDWQIETVDSAGLVGEYASLAVDGTGRPHISYLYGGTCDHPSCAVIDLRYAWHDGTSWHTQTVQSEGRVGIGTSLALDASGHPHIAYCYQPDGVSRCKELRYAWHDGSQWRFQIVDSDWAGLNPSLALDSEGYAHISYYAEFAHALRYAGQDASGWHIEFIVMFPEGKRGPLAVDKSGHPHIAYGDGYPTVLKHVWRDDAGWHTEPVDIPGGSYEINASLAIDGSDQPRISYIGSSGLRYAWRDGGNWHTEAVGPGILCSSLAVDQSGRPHIAFHYYKLNYAWHDGVSWQVDTVDLNWSTRDWISLGLDASGKAHIGYYVGADRSDLRYAYFRPLSFHKQATPSKDLLNNDLLTYTLTLAGPTGMNLALRDSLPSGVQYVTNTITSTLVPPAIYEPESKSVTWVGDLPSDLVHIRFQATPGITRTGSLSLIRPIVNTAWLTDTKRGTSVSASAIVNGWRVYLPLALR